MNWRSMARTLVFSLALIALPFSARGAADGWESVGPGIDYQEFHLSNPINNVYVARMDRNNPATTIESGIGNGKLYYGLETVSGIANRYNEAISYWGGEWGARNRVVVAINGDFFPKDLYNSPPGPTGGQVQSGWYAKHYQDNAYGGGGAAFVWTLDREPFISQCSVSLTGLSSSVFYSGDVVNQSIDDINSLRGTDELVLYTPQYANTTNTDNTGYEVLVQMSRPTSLTSNGFVNTAGITGTVVAKYDQQGTNLIPFGHVVLSASGTHVDKLRNRTEVGQVITITQGIMSKIQPCVPPSVQLPWERAYASVGGSFPFLVNGTIQYFTTNAGATNPAPRTAIVYNDNYIYFIVVDGRHPGVSEGMTIAQLAAFAKGTLGAAWGVAEDGGGSSTMVVNGVVKNDSYCNQWGNSDGCTFDPTKPNERPVANGMMMTVVEPKEQSTAHQPGEGWGVGAGSTLYLGPGTNYGPVLTFQSDTKGELIDNNLNGVRAKGFYWWKAQFGSATGWVNETISLPYSVSLPLISQRKSILSP
ncbi:MAG TPA: phosphodiester glycosidase family protein [Anaerolineales bacterium]